MSTHEESERMVTSDTSVSPQADLSTTTTADAQDEQMIQEGSVGAVTTKAKTGETATEVGSNQSEAQAAPENRKEECGEGEEQMEVAEAAESEKRPADSSTDSQMEGEKKDEEVKASEEEKAMKEEAKDQVAVDEGSKTPPTPSRRTRGRGRGSATPTEEAPPTARRGRKRKGTEEPETPAKAPKTPSRRGTAKPPKLSWEDFFGSRVTGDRVLSCGEGDQLGHPGRSTTKKPRKVDIVEEKGLEVVQVVAGGVHSLLLTSDGTVYTCGINEKGTVPGEGVEPEGSTDKFVPIKFSDEIEKEGKIVQLTAGASFSAALTDQGSVIAWGNLRDSSGLIDVHPLLHKMKETPLVIVHHKSRVMVKIAAGENHLAMLSADGELLTFGDGSMGQLGRSVRASTIRSKYMCDESGRSLVVTAVDPTNRRKTVSFRDVHADGFWTMAKAEDGRIFAFGLNNFGHLGIPVEEKKVENTDDGDSPSEDHRELRVLLPTYAPAFEGHEWASLEGVQHVIARSSDGELYGIGKNTDNALGLGSWRDNNDQEHWRYDSLQKIDLSDASCAGVTAKLGCSIAWTAEGVAYSWGCDTSGQLGLGLKDDDEKVVPKPEEITSAHLDGFKVISVSLADNHAIFLAKKC